MSTDPKQTAELVKAARQAVADLDEPLKTEAFKIVLERFLDQGMVGSAGRNQRDAKSPRKTTSRPKGSQTKSDRKTAIPHSMLKLSVEELKNLKSYCAGFDLHGAEQTAFVLANFAREHTSLESVSANDVAYLHRQLISQKVKVVDVNDVSEWARALSWLTAPSRKKEWLERRGNGFVVSNSGLLQWNEIEEERANTPATEKAR